MSKTAREMDHIDAIAIAIASITPLAAPIDPLHERARASLVERALDLAGFVIVPREPHYYQTDAGGERMHELEQAGTSTDYIIENIYRAMISAAKEPP